MCSSPDQQMEFFSLYKKVSQWETDEVTAWLKGLNESLSSHIPQFSAHCINGAELLKMNRHQLEYLKVSQVGHQELLLEAIELLAAVDNARSRQSTMALASALSKRTSQLVKALSVLSKQQDLEIEQDDEEEAMLVDCMEYCASVLRSARMLISWLDRFPFELITEYTQFRETVLGNAFLLSSAVEKQEFVPHSMIDACKGILKLTGNLMSPECLSTADPVSHITVELQPHHERGLGFTIQRSRHGALVISQVQPQSPASQSGKVYEGVEIIQINQRNVVGWEVKNVVRALKASGRSVSLTLRVSNSKMALLRKKLESDTDSDNDLLNTHPISPPELPPRPAFSMERTSSYPTILPSRRPPLHPSHRPAPPLPPSMEHVNGDQEEQENQNTNGWSSPTIPAPIRQKSRSFSDSTDHTNTRLTSEGDPITPNKPVIAYKTAIIGGVVHRIPIQPVDDITTVPTSGGASAAAKKKGNSLGSGKRKLSLQRSCEKLLSTSRTSSQSSLITNSSTSLGPETGTNEGGDIECGHAVFSDPKDVLIHGQVAKQVTVASSEFYTQDSSVLKSAGKKANPALLVPCFQLKETTAEGWMNKMGGSGLTPKNWRRRWFVLKDRRLYYYKTSFDVTAMGMVDVGGYKFETAPEIKKKHCFKASKPNERTYYLQADSAEELKRWMSTLQEASQITDSEQTVSQSVTSLDSQEDKSEGED